MPIVKEWKIKKISRKGGKPKREKKMSKMASQNESMQEVSFKSDNRKALKNRENQRWTY